MLKIQGDHTENFFEHNPGFRVVTEFAELIEEKGEDGASNILWALTLCYHPESDLFEMRFSDRKKEIEENYLNTDFDWDQQLINRYKDVCLSRMERDYQIWADKLDELSDYLSDLNWSENSKELKSLYNDASKFWETLDKVEERLEKSKSQSRLKGDERQSKREERFE